MTGLELIPILEQALPRVLDLADKGMGLMERSAVAAEDKARSIEAIQRGQAALKKTIQQSTLILGNLVKTESSRIISEIHRSDVSRALNDLASSVDLMNDLLRETDIDKQLADTFVTQTILPLRKSMGSAVRCLEQNNADIDLVSSCKIIGLTAVVAGFEYLGQNATIYRKDLTEELLTLQKRMLSRFAKKTLIEGGEFPWSDVPQLLQLEGAQALAQKYIESGADHEERTPEPAADESASDTTTLPDPATLRVPEALRLLSKINNPEQLAWFTKRERASNKGPDGYGGRPTILEACSARRKELKQNEANS